MSPTTIPGTFILQSPASNDPLLDLNTQPSLDLQFATGKTLNDRVSGNNLITFSRADTTTCATYVDSNGVIQTAAANVPRFDHDPVTGESLGLLIEEERTNYYEASSDVTTPAGVLISGFTPTSDAVTSPDGTQEADRIVETTNASTHYVLGGQDISTTTGEVWTGSLFVKPIPGSASNRYPLLRISGGTGTFGSTGVIFDLVSKQTYYAAGSSYTDSGVIDYPDGWKKIYVTAPALSTGPATFGLAFYSNQNATNFTSGFNYTGDGVSGFYIWGAQVEAGSFPTSYIPTSGSAVTRAVDVASITGTNFSSWYNQSEGTVFAEANATFGDSLAFVGIFYENANSYIDVTRYQPNLRHVTTDSGTSVFTETSLPAGPLYKTAYSFESGSSSFAVDGATLITKTGVQLPAPIVLYIGADGSGIANRELNGHISRLAYYPYRLADATLQEITS